MTKKDEDVDMGGNSESSDRAMTGSGGNKSHQETNVDPFIGAQLLPFADTQNTVCPFYTSGTLSLGSGANSQSTLQLRLNSLVDIVTGTSYEEDPTPTKDTVPTTSTVANPTLEYPMMYNYWSSIYQYYHVVGCRYHLTLMGVDSADQRVSVWTYHHGQQEPPYADLDGTNVVPDYIRQMHPHCHMKKLLFNNSSGGANAFTRSITHVTGNYAPGTKYAHNTIAEDDFVQNWIKVGQVNPLREKVTFILNRDDWTRSINTAAVVIRYELRVTYLVQWKDRVARYEYPTNTTDLSAISNYPVS